MILGPPAIEKVELLDENFIRRQHLKIFRQHLELGGYVPHHRQEHRLTAEKFAMRLVQLVESTRYQRDNATFPTDELVIRFHHELVFIHLFANGNGRHSRLMADILGQRLGCLAFTWGAGVDLVKPGTARRSYLEALRVADKGDITQLLAFARS